MKKFVLTLVVVFGTFQIVSSQADYNEPLGVGFPAVSNLTYLSKVYLKDASGVIKELRLKAANFDVFNAEGYEPNASNPFVVVHKATNGHITVSYDKNGEIITTWERFENVPLSKKVRELVGKKYSGWKIVKNTYRSSYSNGKIETSIYKLKLSNGYRTIGIKVNALEI